MPLKPEQQASLRRRTIEAAAYFVEDIVWFRELLSRPTPSSSDIRRTSGMVRRLLLDGDLPAIAAPRTGRLMLRAPQLRDFQRLSREPVIFVGSGFQGHGVSVRSWCEFDGSLSVEDADIVKNAYLAMIGLQGTADVDLSIDNFLAQRVLRYEGFWQTRKDVLRYLAHIASGVHTGAPKSAEERALTRMRRAIRVTPDGGIHVFPHGTPPRDDDEFVYDPQSLDPVLVVTLDTMRIVAQSPVVIGLEAMVVQELADRSKSIS
jgi:hypothetical protein